CFGFCFEEESKRPFLAEKADALGIPSGPLRRDLVQGKDVMLPDGKRVSPDDILGEAVPGTKLVIVGDTGETKSLEKVCRDADALVIEGTYLYNEVEMAREYGHLTVREAAELAVKANVKQLFITHVSRRYRDKDIEKEALSIFPNSVIAKDFDQFQIKN
ncbi:MAG: ribonuclease Z, partial [Candidatus Methanofastidiosa archaeon]|nr:ribonuclease Z [Candidatus Methanofastidiosa archaeon]